MTDDDDRRRCKAIIDNPLGGERECGRLLNSANDTKRCWHHRHYRPRKPKPHPDSMLAGDWEAMIDEDTETMI